MARRIGRQNRHYGSFLAATVTIGSVAVDFPIVCLGAVHSLSLGAIAYLLAAWAVSSVVSHSWLWIYST